MPSLTLEQAFASVDALLRRHDVERRDRLSRQVRPWLARYPVLAQVPLEARAALLRKAQGAPRTRRILLGVGAAFLLPMAGLWLAPDAWPFRQVPLLVEAVSLAALWLVKHRLVRAYLHREVARRYPVPTP